MCAGTAGGEAQQSDITQLLKELELKKAKLNELRGESRKAEADIARCRDDDTDAQRLTPDGCVVENNYIQVRLKQKCGCCKCYCAVHPAQRALGGSSVSQHKTSVPDIRAFLCYLVFCTRSSNT